MNQCLWGNSSITYFRLTWKYLYFIMFYKKDDQFKPSLLLVLTSNWNDLCYKPFQWSYTCCLKKLREKLRPSHRVYLLPLTVWIIRKALVLWSNCVFRSYVDGFNKELDSSLETLHLWDWIAIKVRRIKVLNLTNEFCHRVALWRKNDFPLFL